MLELTVFTLRGLAHLRLLDVPSRRALPSTSTSHLVVPPIKLSTVASRVLLVAAAQVWNSRSEAVVSSSSLQTFRRHLKTHLFHTSPDFLVLDWHRYSGPCSSVSLFIGHSKTICVYLLAKGIQLVSRCTL